MPRSVTDHDEDGVLGYTGSTATVSAIAQRPGYASQIIVAGSFATAGSLSCQSICSWDSEALQWSSLGTGLQGAVGAIAFAGVSFFFSLS